MPPSPSAGRSSNKHAVNEREGPGFLSHPDTKTSDELEPLLDDRIPVADSGFF
ncbi:hypothetical protein ThimaDRAFT_4035 [Thiocapsa marina 5811]|uniref:Uncharacterized protein n=1 Tax=Thiocapsa marina 5811 TaxID=768671 RepID=F9UGI2_9GAMM|nr:hypothetical protein ThimaDRAFT_4035 [Thiocapsa marina 5811]